MPSRDESCRVLLFPPSVSAPSAVLLAGCLLLAAGGGWAVLGRLFRDEERETRWDVAAALGLPVGLLLSALPGWLLSAAVPVPIGRVVLPLWLLVPALLLVLLRRSLPAPPERRLRAALPFLVFLLVLGAYLWLRFSSGDVRPTEKPMDFAVLTALTTTPSLPLADPWMAGERFPYYHFGTVLFALPLRLSGIAPEVGYNVVCAVLAAVAAAAAFGAVRSRGGGPGLALGAAFLLAFAGTFDGARQLIAGVKLGEVNFWDSSRRVADTITEWPLFTLHLGDLHPHAVAMPLLLALVALAGRVAGPKGVVLDGVLLAALLSANPWDLPAGLLVVAAGALVGLGPGRAVLRGAATVAASVPFLVPFLLSPRPEMQGLRSVTGATTAPEAFLHFGALLLVPALAVGVALVRAGKGPDESLFLATLFPAAALAVVVLTHRPVLGLAAGFVLAAAYMRTRVDGALRSGFLLAAAACALVAIPELVAVKDPYGEQFHRMNTVFKCYAGAAVLLSVAAPLLLPLPLSSRRLRLPVRGLLGLAFLATLAHPLNLAVQRARAGEGTLDGLAWLSREMPGDRQAVDWLRENAPPTAVVLESVGSAYVDNARVGTASGRPTVLGWSQHEGLWRGAQGQGEVDRRIAEVKTVYSSQDAAEVAAVLARHRVRYVVLGPLERREFGEAAFPLQGSYRKVLDSGGTALFEVGRP